MLPVITQIVWLETEHGQEQELQAADIRQRRRAEHGSAEGGAQTHPLTLRARSAAGVIEADAGDGARGRALDGVSRRITWWGTTINTPWPSARSSA
jgi:hypothetical protein